MRQQQGTKRKSNEKIKEEKKNRPPYLMGVKLSVQALKEAELHRSNLFQLQV